MRDVHQLAARDLPLLSPSPIQTHLVCIKRILSHPAMGPVKARYDDYLHSVIVSFITVRGRGLPPRGPYW